MKKLNVFLLHAAYWTVYFLFLGMLYLTIRQIPHPTPDWYLLAMTYGIGLTAGAMGFYLGYFPLFTEGVSKKKWPKILLFGAVAFVVSGVFGWLTAMQLTGWRAVQSLQVSLEISFYIGLIIGLPNIFLGVGLRSFVEWFLNLDRGRKLEQENHAMEMALIKAQINPHFLFNTIANIDVLIEKDPVLASNYLNKLSGIMRFMLYETQAESIPLSKELDYIEQYIALQKIRFSNPEKVQFSVHGSVDAQRIAPMLFIPFIENAFKFGETKKSEAMISIEFRISAKEIQFECKNAFQPTLESIKDSGLGNVLIAKRIAHLYPEKHLLGTSVKDGIYHVKLTISHP